MRSLSQAMIAGLGLIMLTAAPADALDLAMPLGVRQAADATALIAPVHCRKYLHRHGSRRTRGCDEGGVSIIAPQRSTGSAPSGVGRAFAPPSVTLPSTRPPGNYVNPSNPQDRSGTSNPQDMTTPRSMNPQDMR